MTWPWLSPLMLPLLLLAAVVAEEDLASHMHSGSMRRLARTAESEAYSAASRLLPHSHAAGSTGPLPPLKLLCLGFRR